MYFRWSKWDCGHLILTSSYFLKFEYTKMYATLRRHCVSVVLAHRVGYRYFEGMFQYLMGEGFQYKARSYTSFLASTPTFTDIHKQTCMSKKKQKNPECSYFLTACLTNSFQLLPGWEGCYGNTRSTKSNMGFISKWTQNYSTKWSRVMRPSVLTETTFNCLDKNHVWTDTVAFVTSVLVLTVGGCMISLIHNPNGLMSAYPASTNTLKEF